MAEHEHPNAIRIQPCLVAYNNPEQGLVVMLNVEEFETPGIWGIVLADVVGHIVNAYAEKGMAAVPTRQEIIHYLASELEKPSARAESLDGEWGDEGFVAGMEYFDDEVEE
jgi:hypothetical protein